MPQRDQHKMSPLLYTWLPRIHEVQKKGSISRHGGVKSKIFQNPPFLKANYSYHPSLNIRKVTKNPSHVMPKSGLLKVGATLCENLSGNTIPAASSSLPVTVVTTLKEYGLQIWGFHHIRQVIKS